MRVSGWGRGAFRKCGGGRKPIAESDPELVAALERLVAEDCRGDPMQVLLWTSKSVRKLAVELREQGHEAHFTTVAHLLRSLGYSLQSNRKTLEGAQHPDRDAQFRLINERVGAAIAAGEPAISIDTKKRGACRRVQERGARVASQGRADQGLHPRLPEPGDRQGDPVRRRYDIASNEGFANVGITTETAQLAVASIRAWWQDLGSERYPFARSLQITADCGGGNGNRVLAPGKTELQNLADQTGLQIRVCHFRPVLRSGTKSSTRARRCAAGQRRSNSVSFVGVLRPQALDELHVGVQIEPADELQQRGRLAGRGSCRGDQPVVQLDDLLDHRQMPHAGVH